MLSTLFNKVHLKIFFLLMLVVLASLTIVFSVEIDNGYSWSGGYFIMNGQIPYYDFYCFQFPPLSYYLSVIIVCLSKSIIIGRVLLMLLFVILSYFIISNLTITRKAVSFIFFSYLTFIICAFDANARLIQLDSSKNYFSSLLILMFLLLWVKKNRLSKVSFVSLIFILTLFISLKLTNIFIIIFFVFIQFVRRDFLLEGRRNIFLFAMVLIFIFAIPLIFYFNKAVYIQSFLVLSLNYPEDYSGRLSLFNLITIISIFIAQISFPLLFYYFIRKYLPIQDLKSNNYNDLISFESNALQFSFSFIFISLLLPPRTQHGYIFPALPILFLAISIRIFILFQLTNNVNKLRVLFFSSIIFVLSTNLLVAFRLIRADSHTVHPVGLSLSLGLKDVSSYISFKHKNDSSVFFALRWPQPVVMAGLDLHPLSAMGNNLLGLEHTSGKLNWRKNNLRILNEENIVSNKLLTIDVFREFLISNPKALLVLDSDEAIMVNEILINSKDKFRLKLVYTPNRNVSKNTQIGVYSIEFF
jgi:hypothetical protein